ncbi:glycoside hydrolase family 43 protein [Microbacterium phosphatis]|uniref:glycoside hydrolase family 43 protein n=1 Tax=Microbacterium phosphatis TaxID=3140248 RepID=UPI00313FF593
MTPVSRASVGGAPTGLADGFGYLLVHFVEDQAGHAEKIYFSLSVGDDPLRWRRLNGGDPILEWTSGTTGVRDPHIVRGPGGFHLVATDLRVWKPDGVDWEGYRHRGSRDIVVWDSPDLVTWDAPRAVSVAPAGAGMAWAPESVYDPVRGDFLVHWASGLAGDGGDGRTGPARILGARTRDFRTFDAPRTLLERPGGVIDMTIAVLDDGRVIRFAKQDDGHPGSWRIFQQVGSGLDADDFQTVARDLGQHVAEHVEGPLVFRAHGGERWFLWVDQYSRLPQGYHALTSADPAGGVWEPVPEADFDLPPDTKHGAVLPLRRHEHEALRARWGA